MGEKVGLTQEKKEPRIEKKHRAKKITIQIKYEKHYRTFVWFWSAFPMHLDIDDSMRFSVCKQSISLCVLAQMCASFRSFIQLETKW